MTEQSAFPPASVADHLQAAEAWPQIAVSRALFEQSPLSTVIYDPQGHLIAANAAFSALWGVGIESAPPDYSVLTDPQLEQQGILPSIRRAFEGETVRTPPVRYDIAAVSATHAGRTVWTEAHLYPVRGADGRIAYVVLIHIDISARVSAEQALRTNEERFRGAQEASPDLFTVFRALRDEAGQVVDFVWEYANPPAAHMQGASLADLVGQSMLNRNPRVIGSGLFTRYAATVDSGEPFETELHDNQDGLDRWFRITCVKLGDGIAVTASDVTDRRVAQERARALLGLAAALSEAATPEQVAEVIFREGLGTLRADGGSLAVVHESGPDGVPHIEMIRTRGYSAEAEDRFRSFPVTAGRPLSDAVISGRSVLLNDRESWEKLYPAQFPIVDQLGYEAYAALPVLVGGRAVAGISFSFRGARDFDDETRTFLDTVGRLCAQALERARAYDAERRERFRSEAILESTRDGFVALDREFRFTFANQRAAEMLSSHPAEMAGKRFWDLFPEIENSPFTTAIREAAATRSVITQEGFSTAADRWIEARIYPADDDGVVIVFQDTTQRRRAQIAAQFLAEASVLLSSSMDVEVTMRNLAHAAVPRLGDWCAVEIIVDPAARAWPPVIDRVAMVHQDPGKIAVGTALLTEYPRDWSAADGLPGVLREGKSAFWPVITTEMLTQGAKDARHVQLLSTLQFTSVMIVPLIARGVTLGALTLCMSESGRRYDEDDLRVAQDLAERAAIAVDNARLYGEANQARREAETFADRLARVFRQAPVAIAVLRGPEHVFETCNALYERIVGRTGIVGLPVREALPELEGQGIIELLDNVLRTGEPYVGTETQLSLDRGPLQAPEDAWFNFVFQPLVDAQGSTIGIAVVAVEVTTQVQARSDAERLQHVAEDANRAKSEFLATMSHELRTPLNAIGGYTELLEMGLRGPLTSAQRDDLQRIKKSQQHLLGLINSVLNFARLEAGRVTYVTTEVPLCDLLHEAVALMEPQAVARNVGLVTANCPGGCRALGDPEKIRQIVFNLLSNAIKFTPAGGTVTLECGPESRADPQYARIDVIDTGIGISTDNLNSVFDPFVQVGRSLTSSHEGAGLGLAISRDLARGMGGDLVARSTEGQGSTFTLTLPVP